MKLNNQGWSLNQMILCCAILLIAFFFAIFFSMQLMREFGESFKESVTGKVTYATIERNIVNGANLYMEKYYKEEIGNGTITILTDNLIQYTLIKESDLITSDKDSCKGYALVRENNNVLEIEPYITCSNYITKDFKEWRMGEVYE